MNFYSASAGREIVPGETVVVKTWDGDTVPVTFHGVGDGCGPAGLGSVLGGYVEVECNGGRLSLAPLSVLDLVPVAR